MQFGPVALDRAEGAVLAHSVMLAQGRLRKGQVLAAADLGLLRAAGVAQVVVARLGPGDVAEDDAAAALARALVPQDGWGLMRSEAFTGRVNLNAVGPGVVEVDAAAVLALNRVDPAITLATLAPMTRVQAGTLVGTVKIIAYGVEAAALAQACEAARGALRVRPVVMTQASLILTEVPGQDPKLSAKGKRAVESRLRALGMRLAAVEVVAHDEAAIAQALARADGDMVLILTGSATSDLYDTAPQALRAAGGAVARFGMPVDPGNLLFLGNLAGRPVVGLPGCARSPALNGADWVLERLACGLQVSSDNIAAMGVGGLLKEIPIRPQLREPK
ncbi:MAG: molybdenum cofactor cytidylyltransferase [Rhodobacteraceae bacterium]|uniref:molybdopterin-binding protein n=1 Tax=Cypionkella sp. TaxID=2811411 RepID=UPI001324BED6|nr:molybdopterin-binding protein [Cypionkella sp.]KAF0170575.1 MAG: molybdenum cofactor cytidylyltransferase [Paracoccaceae bacterium]MDO8326095.1 molybdopterin-binding protein [Cypionkella sp.]